MSEPAYRRNLRRTRRPAYASRIGSEALHFARWFMKSKFALMDEFLGELRLSPEERDAADVERRFLAATRHARRIQTARGAVTVLLAAGILATTAATLARHVVLPALVTQATLALLDEVAAIAGSLAVLLVVARLSFDRYLEMVEVSATFLAMQLATCSPQKMEATAASAPPRAPT